MIGLEDTRIVIATEEGLGLIHGQDIVIETEEGLGLGLGPDLDLVGEGIGDVQGRGLRER